MNNCNWTVTFKKSGYPASSVHEEGLTTWSPTALWTPPAFRWELSGGCPLRLGVGLWGMSPRVPGFLPAGAQTQWRIFGSHPGWGWRRKRNHHHNCRTGGERSHEQGREAMSSDWQATRCDHPRLIDARQWHAQGDTTRDLNPGLAACPCSHLFREHSLQVDFLPPSGKRHSRPHRLVFQFLPLQTSSWIHLVFCFVFRGIFFFGGGALRGMWNLSSLTRDWTWAPFIGSTESEPWTTGEAPGFSLDHSNAVSALYSWACGVWCTQGTHSYP